MADNPIVKLSFETKSTDGTPPTLEEVLSHLQVDTDLYEVVNYWPRMNLRNGTYTFGYRLNLRLKQADPNDVDFEKIKATMLESIPVRDKKPSVSTKPTIMVAISDIHLGGPGSSEAVVRENLQKVKHILDQRYSGMPIHLALLGDFWENANVGGQMMHFNQATEMEDASMYSGLNGIMLMTEILTEFCHSLKNLSEISIVSGNHDRLSVKREQDQVGEATSVMVEFLKLKLPRFKINYDPTVLSVPVGSFQAILTHGHRGLSKKSMESLILDRGDSEKYNVLLSGHYHTLSRKQVYEVENNVIVHHNRRSEVVPQFSGSFSPGMQGKADSYARDNGYSGNNGFKVVAPSIFGNSIDVTDFTL